MYVNLTRFSYKIVSADAILYDFICLSKHVSNIYSLQQIS